MKLATEAHPSRYAGTLRRYRYGPATLKVDWALDAPIPWTAAQAREAGTVHVGGNAAEVLETTSTTSGLPERPFLLLGQQSLADPTRAPPGRHTAWAYTHGPQGVDWESERDRHVERIEPRSSASPPAFASTCSRATCSVPATSNDATRTSSAATSAAAATRSAR